jgi:hypothetical protein
MTLTAPDWLVQHGGKVRLGSDGQTWFISFSDHMDYSLTVTPVADKFGPVLRLTTNGRRFETPGAFGTREEALQAGLEELRKQLGW